MLGVAHVIASLNKQGLSNEVDAIMEYLVVVEKDRNGYSAYVPDLPGCIAAGETLRETRELIAEAIAFHIQGLRDAGYPVPAPSVQNYPVDPKDDKDNQ